MVNGFFWARKPVVVNNDGEARKSTSLGVRDSFIVTILCYFHYLLAVDQSVTCSYYFHEFLLLNSWITYIIVPTCRLFPWEQVRILQEHLVGKCTLLHCAFVRCETFNYHFLHGVKQTWLTFF